jgi:hypothetical protein
MGELGGSSLLGDGGCAEPGRAQELRATNREKGRNDVVGAVRSSRLRPRQSEARQGQPGKSLGATAAVGEASFGSQ